jgi:two-component system chemotaxis sensor kinase CheA
MDASQYMTMFLEESKEHLQALNESLLELENDPTNLSVLDVIFRSAHTIKGMSATMGFSTIAELTHVMENVLDMMRKSVIVADHDIIDILFQCVDTLEQLVENVATGEDHSVDIHPLLDKLNALVNAVGGDGDAHAQPAHHQAIVPAAQAAKAKTAQPADEIADDDHDIGDVDITIEINTVDEHLIKSAADQGLQAYEVSISLNADCMLKAARVYMIMNTLDEFGDVIKTIPEVEELEKGNFETSFQLIILTSTEPDKIESSVNSISEIETVVALPITFRDSHLGSKLEKPVRETSAEQDVKQPRDPSAGAMVPSSAHPGAPDKVEKHVEHKISKNTQSVRVDIDKLDVLLNLVGELVINKTRLEHIGITHRLSELVETIEQMNRVTTDLQAVVMKVRMVPVGQVFNRFPRMVRDLSRELKKEINLVIQGEETELDRTVIDEIGDPLMHLLRNSIDHGVEHPNERIARGKKPTGEVRLVANHEGNNVIITVEDDGHGINHEVIKRKAIEKGVITAAEAEKMDPSEAVRLIFAPGFSTADVVTDVSGRGVGMDVVKTKIESLGGMVDVETKLGEGSKFKIRLPLTLAIIQALLIKVSEEIYAIPLGVIDSTISISPNDIKTIQSQEVILLRGQIIPIVRLARVLCVPRMDEELPEELSVVIVHVGDYRLGIIVDSLIGQQEIVIKSIGKLLVGIKAIAGGTVLGNGQVALILDVGALK